MAKYKLSEIFELQMGKTPDRHNADFWTNGTEPWISIADLSKCGKYIENTAESISEEAVEKSGIKLIPSDTVVMSFKLSIGKVAITPKTMYSNEAIMAFISKGVIHIEPTYLYYLLMHHDWDAGTNKAVMGKTLNKATLSEITVNVHEHAEQLAIVRVLDKALAIIDARKQQLAELDNLVKARFVELFELHSWPKCKTSTFMDNMRNGVSPSNAGTHKARVLTLSAITQGAFDRSAWKEGDFDCIPSEDKRVSACDFYMCRGNGNRNLVGSGVYSKENLYDLVFPDTVIAARVDTNMVRLPFLCEAWKRPSIRNQIEAGARTTNGTFKINQKVIANIDISLPPIELQDSFATFVEQTDKSKFSCECGGKEAYYAVKYIWESLCRGTPT